VPIDTTAVTHITGQSGHWNISRNLGGLYRPVNGVAEDQVAVSLLKGDPQLQDLLVSMIWPEVHEMVSIAQKDGKFGVLFERRFNCAESNCKTGILAAHRSRVEHRILADIANEVRLNPRLQHVDLAIAEPQVINSAMVGLWAFVSVDAMQAHEWDYGLLDEVLALLVE
jgi:hypothetical protein